MKLAEIISVIRILLKLKEITENSSSTRKLGAKTSVSIACLEMMTVTVIVVKE
jgi:hypothetical protein